jgi:hypothetical protein
MYFLNPRLAADVFEGEYIIANLDTGLYYSIQGLAVSLVKAMPFQDPQVVIRLFADAFPDTQTAIENELTLLLKELLDEGIIIQDENTDLAITPICTPPSEYIPSRFNRYADMQDLLLLDPIHDVNEEGWTVQKGNN